MVLVTAIRIADAGMAIGAPIRCANETGNRFDHLIEQAGAPHKALTGQVSGHKAVHDAAASVSCSVSLPTGNRAASCRLRLSPDNLA